MQQHPIELLSPARDLACGIAAVNHGADAVYIGAPKFSARSAAGNSLSDIEKLVRHAHIFNARVYIALNTIFNDGEIEEAARLAHKLYDAGADALIIQDMGLLECDLPPIPLHASTQCNNRTPEKVEFLEKCGFQQIVLARELSLAQIQEIRAKSTVPLECFVHGALCVSYSGQCYISEVMTGRSANRGECAQFCRHKFTLRDGSGKILAKDKYFLSLKDLDLSAHLQSLIDAGVSSLKIEGRLKGVDYVKNVTAYYRKALDKIIDADDSLQRLSSGRCQFSFTPDTSKSFNRGKTDYFLTKKRNTPGSIDTPKSLGEKLGNVIGVERDRFTVATDKQINNGDGLCYFDERGQLLGLKANRVESRGGEQFVFHREKTSPHMGALLYRNSDVAFLRELQQSKQCRSLQIRIRVYDNENGLVCDIEDEDMLSSQTKLTIGREVAKKRGMMAGVIERQLRKVGGTVYEVESVSVEVDPESYYPVSAINELRRLACDNHLQQRLSSYQRLSIKLDQTEHLWLSDTVTYQENINNERARAFYNRHSVKNFKIAGKGLLREERVELMRTRYCLKAQLGLCPRGGTVIIGAEGLKSNGKNAGVFTLTDNTGVYKLEFDCAKCEVVIRKG
ncbi:peptidase U32 family protein [Desulfosediminicola sp.]|uniref:peptidase U32 family protein n=1 Tax=Desulfosediminicola sp. TaxID=2886825 RepID=UPI003AF1FA92